jgi:hypothetical protein
MPWLNHGISRFGSAAGLPLRRLRISCYDIIFEAMTPKAFLTPVLRRARFSEKSVSDIQKSEMNFKNRI